MTTLYRFFDSSDALLYVGIADNVVARLGQHRSDKPWWPEVAKVAFEDHFSRDAAAHAERNAIVTEHPRHNIMHNNGKKAAPVARQDKAPNGLIGRFLLTPDEKVGWPLCSQQGVVVDQIGDATFLVQWFSWLHGGASNSELITLDEMKGWRFYSDQEDWQYAAETASRARDR